MFEPISENMWNVLRIWYNADEELTLSRGEIQTKQIDSFKLLKEPVTESKRKTIDEGPLSSSPRNLSKVKTKI